MDIQWPECVIKGEIPEDLSDEQILCDALFAWGLCYIEYRPETFGKYIIEVNKRLGVCLPEDLIKLVNEKLKG